MGHQSAGLRSKQVLTEELAEIERRFASADASDGPLSERLVGLAFSGGGIRSALSG
jgi:hypothetical protein